ncbi:MAG TPA: hypothetical protein PKG71_04690 [Candidatus Woesebacteria bacterium]|nr:hypothetical protein [Candidatus Woesebacteria bacterium]HNS95235.1 hypothetical protein [Candidatus Woesebacteria bacterium]
MKTTGRHNILAIAAYVLIVAIGFLFTYQPLLHKLSVTFSPLEVEELYNSSQYVLPAPKETISDAVLNAHAGYQNITGYDPTLISGEHPPFAKYLIGLGFLITGYWKTTGIALSLALMVGITLWIWSRTKSHLATTTILFLLITDTNVRYQLLDGPLMDIIQITMLMTYIFFFTRFMKLANSHTSQLGILLPAGISLGLLASSKMFFPAVLIGVVSLFYSLTINRRLIMSTLIKILSLFVLAGATYTLTYAIYFVLYEKSIIDFIKTQLWMLHYWIGNPVNDTKVLGALIPLVLFNKWFVWWGDSPIIAYEEWSIMWPIGFIAMIVSFIVYARTRTNPHWEKIRYVTDFIALWLIAVFLYLLTVPISPRYLLLLYVPGYVFIALTIYAARIQNK